MHFNEQLLCFRWQETTKLVLNFNTKTSNLVILDDLMDLMGKVLSLLAKHMGVQRRIHRFAHLIVQIILCYWLWFTHDIQPLYFSSCHQHQIKQCKCCAGWNHFGTYSEEHMLRVTHCYHIIRCMYRDVDKINKYIIGTFIVLIKQCRSCGQSDGYQDLKCRVISQDLFHNFEYRPVSSTVLWCWVKCIFKRWNLRPRPLN